jgi:hypothetical protein
MGRKALIGIALLGALASLISLLSAMGRIAAGDSAPGTTPPNVVLPGGAAQVEVSLRETSLDGLWTCRTAEGAEPLRFVVSESQELPFTCEPTRRIPDRLSGSTYDTSVTVRGRIVLPADTPEGQLVANVVGSVAVPKKMGKDRFQLKIAPVNHRLAIQVVSREKLRELREQEGAQAVRDAKQRSVISAVFLVASLALVVFTVRRRS